MNTDENIPELKPCPFCPPSDRQLFINSAKRGGWRVACVKPSCKARGPYRKSRKEAAEAWNERP